MVWEGMKCSATNPVPCSTGHWHYSCGYKYILQQTHFSSPTHSRDSILFLVFLINLRKLKVNKPQYFHDWLQRNKYSNISKGRAGGTTERNLEALPAWALWSNTHQCRSRVGPKAANYSTKCYSSPHSLDILL